MTPNEWDNVTLFLQCLEAELGRLPDGFAPDTVFIGGGTPTALEPGDYARMLEAIHGRIDLSRVVEFSSEANPGTLTPEKLAVMREGGVNRVSIGVQSFNNRALRLLGRIHKAQEAVDGYYLLREAGFDNVNIDLIQSIPGMTPEDVLADARKVAELGPEHVSFYNLIYEPGTPMTRDRDAGRIVEPGEDEEADNYFAVRDLLVGAGYEHYEISNFSMSGRRCLHNVLYWEGGEYFGCGPSAHSHWKGRRFGNIPDLQVYCDRLQENERPFDEIETLQSEEKARETLVMWLRMTEGVDLARFREVTGYEVDALCGPAVESLEEEGLLQRQGNRLALSRNALFVSNAVFSELV
jgi:oxygen-independent coproporphyrinogen-3 oxidase